MRLGFGIAVLIGGMALIGAVALTAPPASATTVTYLFGDCTEIVSSFPGSCPGDTGTSTLTYDTGGRPDKPAAGFTSGTPTNLFVKQGGPAETGLGITANTADHEIRVGDLIQLDTSLLQAAGATGSDTLSIQSVQSGESFQVCESATPGSLGSVNCVTGSNPGTGGDTQNISIPLSSADPLVGVTALSGDVLLDNETVNIAARIPEPGSMTLFATGLVGLVLLRRRLGR